jgi:hypothetical protein
MGTTTSVRAPAPFDERYDTCMAANVSLVQHQIRNMYDLL